MCLETMQREDETLQLCRYKLCAVVPERRGDEQFYDAFVKHSEK